MTYDEAKSWLKANAEKAEMPCGYSFVRLAWLAAGRFGDYDAIGMPGFMSMIAAFDAVDELEEGL